jgi:glutamate-1-semialdehyde aminotransferase
LDRQFLVGLRDITARYGVLLIYDEIVTGFRFSPGGVQQLDGMTPDLSCFAKIMAGGLPGGAVVGRAEIMKLFDRTGEPDHDRFQRVTHLGTFNASPLSAAAGIVCSDRWPRGIRLSAPTQRARSCELAGKVCSKTTRSPATSTGPALALSSREIAHPQQGA